MSMITAFATVVREAWPIRAQKSTRFEDHSIA